MSSNLSLQVILSLVDKLTGPAKDAAKSLDALGKEARGASEQLGKPAWTEQPRALQRAAEAATGLGGALGGVARAAEDAEQTLRRPTWTDHGRAITGAAQAARGWADAVGGALGGVTRAAEQADRAMLAPGWVEGFRRATAATEQAARGWADAVGGAMTTASARIKEPTEALANAERQVGTYEREVAGVSGAWKEATTMLTAFIAAHTGLKTIEDTLKAGADAAHQQVSMQTSGMSPQTQTDVHAAAAKMTAQFPTHTQTEIEGMITRAAAIVPGGVEEAIGAMPDLLKLKTITDAEMPGASEGFEQILRGLEIGGFTKDKAKLHGAVDMIARTINFNKGSIRPEDYNEFFKYLGSGFARHLDPEFLAGAATTIIQELRGSSAGVGLRAFENAVFTDRMTGKAAKFFDQNGLIGDESKVIRNSKGEVKSLNPGALVDPELALFNPFLWLHKYVGSTMDKSHLNDLQRMEIEMGMFQNSGAAQIADIFLSQPERVARDTAGSKGAMGLDEAAKAWIERDPTTALKALGAQGQNWFRSAGEPLMSGLTGDVRVATKAVTLETQNAPGWLNPALAGGAAVGGLYAGWQGFKAMGEGGLGGLAKWLAPAVEGFAVPLLAGLAVKEGLDLFDTKGNMFGLTTPIDNYFKRKFGWNPANLFERGAPPEGAAYDPLYDPNSPKNMHRTLQSLHHAGYVTWSGKTGYHDTGELAREEDHESRRGWAASPSARAAAGEAYDALQTKAVPQVDTSALEAARAKAESTGAAMKTALEQPAVCKVDSASIDAALGKAHELARLLGQINGAAGRMSVPNFTPRSAPLHDGPEAR